MPPAPRKARSPRLRGRDGFTLVEVLAAFVILAVFAVVVQRGVVVAGAGLFRADGWMEAEAIARTLLTGPSGDSASIGRQTGSTRGHEWTVITEPLPLPAGEAEGDAAAVWRPVRMIVRVAVAPGVTFEVETVRLMAAESG